MIVFENNWVVLWIDASDWYFPLCIHYETYGNRHRPWALKIGFLCAELTVYLSEELRQKK